MTVEENQSDSEEQEATSRRSFLGKAGIGVAGLAASSAVLAACSTTSAADDGEDSNDEEGGSSSGGGGEPDIEWDMATSWPTSLVTLYGSAEVFAEQVLRLTNGKLKINPKPAGEIVPGTEVLSAVQDGGAPAGHTASYYYTESNSVNQFGTAVPFGLTQRQQFAWLYEGGGLDLLNEFYAQEYNIISFPAGSTGVQMGGWFTKEINSVSDLQGLKMRIPGKVAGTVLNNLGGEQVSVPGGEILQQIQSGGIDAAEFVGPTDDLILGLNELDNELFYYHPGWWEPGTTLDVQINLDQWNELPETYQAAVENAAAHANLRALAKYDVSNPDDFIKIEEFATVKEFSPELMAAFKEETEKVLDEQAAENEAFAAILKPWREYRDKVSKWHATAELSYLSQQSQV